MHAMVTHTRILVLTILLVLALPACAAMAQTPAASQDAGASLASEGTDRDAGDPSRGYSAVGDFIHDFQALIAAALAILAAVITAMAIRASAVKTAKATVRASTEQQAGMFNATQRTNQELERRELRGDDAARRKVLRDDFRKRWQLAAALRGEFLAIGNLLRDRKLAEACRAYEAALRAMDQPTEGEGGRVGPDNSPSVPHFPLTPGYFPVYCGSAAQIGDLEEPIPETLATVYARALGIADMLQAIVAGADDAATQEERIESAARLLRSVEKLESQIADAAKELDDVKDEMQSWERNIWQAPHL